MLLTGLTRSPLCLAPRRNVCDRGNFCFSIRLTLLWLTVTFCFRHIGLSIPRSKDWLGIPNVIFKMKLFRNVWLLREAKGATLRVSKPYMRVLCATQEKAHRKVSSYCTPPQCQGKHIHVTKKRNCFDISYCREYHS